jgi:hypothetical protein
MVFIIDWHFTKTAALGFAKATKNGRWRGFLA